MTSDQSVIINFISYKVPEKLTKFGMMGTEYILIASILFQYLSSFMEGPLLRCVTLYHQTFDFCLKFLFGDIC